MKHLFTLKSLLLTLVMLCGLNAWGEEVVLTTANYTWKAENKQVTQTIDPVTFDFNGGTAAPTYYDDGLRTYEGCVITISSKYKISNIAFSYTINNNGCLKKVTTGTWDNSTKTWSGEATTVSLTVGHSSGTKNGQVRITKIVVTCDIPADVLVAPVITETSEPAQDGKYYLNTNATATIDCKTVGATIQYAITGDDVKDANTIASWTEGSKVPEVSKVSFTSSDPATKILWAKAVKEGNESPVASKEFTFIEKPNYATFEQVTSESQIVPGRKYVIAAVTKPAVMGAISSGDYFTSISENVTYADNKLTFIEEDAVYVTFEKAAANFANGHANDDANNIWNVKVDDKYINSTTVKKMFLSALAPENVVSLTINADGNFVLTFTVNDSGSEKPGSFLFNASSPRFTTYASGQTAIQLFREPEAMASVMGATAKTDVKLPVSVVGRKVFGNYLLASTVNNGGAQLESPSLAEAKHFWSNDPEKFNQESWIAIEGLDDNYVGKEFEVGQTLTAAGADDIYGFPTYTVATPSTSDYAGALAINNYSASNFNIGRKYEAVTNVWLVAPQLGEYCQIHGYVGDKAADATTAFVQADEKNSNVFVTVYHNNLSTFTPGWYNIEGVVAKDGEGLAIYATVVDTATGVEGVETSSVKVYGAEGVINVESEEVAPIAVYSANGAIVSSVEASSASIAVAPGFYIVKAGNSVSKVTVK